MNKRDLIIRILIILCVTASLGCRSEERTGSDANQSLDSAEPFSKPEIEGRYFPPHERLDFEEMGYARLVVQPREYMRSDSGYSNVWLHEGEDAIIDVSFGLKPSEIEGGLTAEAYHMYVLVGHRPAEFELRRLADGKDPAYPPKEEFGEAEMKPRFSVDTEFNVANNFSLRIPASAFSEKKVHDLLIVLTGQPKPPTGEYPFIKRLSFSFDLQVHYGSNERRSPGLAGFDMQRAKGPPWLEEATRKARLLLMPSEDVYTTDGIGDWEELHLGEVFETQSTGQRIRGFLKDPLWGDEPGARTHLFFLKNGQLIDGMAYAPDIPLPSEEGDLEGWGNRFSVEIDTTGPDITTLQAVWVQSPFPEALVGTRVHFSNPLFFRAE